jgi:tRNA A-37 threonylcarbamoyl transferase component Bud32
LNKTLDFISPELYAWGEIRGYKPYDDSPRFKVMYLIIEYIPFVKLKDISQISNITEIYERIDLLDKELKALLLHHNDLHSSNILVSCRSPLPDLCILDFGEASRGPRKRIE